MRSLDATVESCNQLNKYTSLADLRLALQDEHEHMVLSTGLRSVCWKSFLLFESLDRTLWRTKLQGSRDAYASLREHLLRGFEHPDEIDTTADPLSENADSPWNQLRKDEVARQEILLDVERCMPENLYFRQPSTQSLLQDVLFIWSKLNPDIGYRQGMHEILAPILWVIERDAIDPVTIKETPINEDAKLYAEVFDARYIVHDTFTLFNVIMRGIKASYEQSIVGRSKRIIDEFIAKTDPELATHLLEIEIAPQIFILRWIRLLFGREFAFDDCLSLWDRIFADEPLFDSLDLICCAVLLRKRWQLIESDYNQVLALLLQSPQIPTDHNVSSFVDDATYLRAHLNAEGGRTIIAKRTGYSPPSTTRPGTPSSQGRISLDGGSERRRWRTNTPTRSSQPSPSIESLVQDAARGVYSKGERLGFNKAVRDAVSEVKKNVQGLQGKSRQHGRQGSNLANALDTSDSTRADLLRRIDALEAKNKSLAQMLQGAVGDLWEQQKETAKAKTSDDEQVQAFTRAIAKVQFVQVYLEDPSLPLMPEDTAVINSEKSDQSHETTVDNLSQKSTFASPEVEHSAQATTTTVPQDQPLANNSDAAIPIDSDYRPEGNGKGTPKATASERPTLAKSQFSWMLGQEESSEKRSPASSNVLTRPEFPKGVRQSPYGSSNAFLFGESSPSEEKGEDVFSMGSMESKKR